jgi:hypothetical protein
MVEGSFTVTFEPPYWVGIAERHDEAGYSAARIIYGSEPNDETILRSIGVEYRLLKFSEPSAEAPKAQHELNYKRRQKEIRRMMVEEVGASHEAAEAIKAERERQAEERKRQVKAEREAEEEKKLLLRQVKNKEKRKGH